MSVLARVLPPSEWARVVAIETAPFLPHLNPTRDEVLVMEDHLGEIVSSAALIHTVNLHGWQIAPAYRGRPEVIFAGMRLLKARTRAHGFQCVTTAVARDYVADICRGVNAVPLPLEHFVISVEA